MTTPLPGMTVVGRLGLAALNIQTKFAIYNYRYTHYEDIKIGPKCRNWVVWGG